MRIMLDYYGEGKEFLFLFDRSQLRVSVMGDKRVCGVDVRTAVGDQPQGDHRPALHERQYNSRRRQHAPADDTWLTRSRLDRQLLGDVDADVFRLRSTYQRRRLTVTPSI